MRGRRTASAARRVGPPLRPRALSPGKSPALRAYVASLAFWPDEREVRRAEGEHLARQGIAEKSPRPRAAASTTELQGEVASAMLAYLRGDKGTVRRICAEGSIRSERKEGVEEFHWLRGLVLDARLRSS